MKIEKQVYEPLDGLRAICFLVVFLFHCNAPFFQLGWSGVSIFFTISGFLITEILMASKESKTYFKTFYLRRILRIFPVYYILIFIATAVFVGFKGFLPNDFVYNILYLQNVLWVFTDYVSDLQLYLAHTWSLAIEEQFYLFWPLFVYFIPNRRIWVLCVGTIILAISYRLMALYWFSEHEFARSILLLSQMDLLALGGLLACLKNHLFENRMIVWLIRNAIVVGGIGLLGIILLVGYVNGDVKQSYDLLKVPMSYVRNPFTIQIYFFIGLIAVGLIKLCIEKKRIIVKYVLMNKSLRYMGKISYGLYLYHWPVLVLLREWHVHKYVLPILALGLTVLISMVSFKLIEMRFNSLKAKINY